MDNAEEEVVAVFYERGGRDSGGSILTEENAARGRLDGAGPDERPDVTARPR